MSDAVGLDVAVQGGGPITVVALHGIQGTRASWQPVIAAAPRPVRWVLPHLRGRGTAFHGTSPADYTLDAYADDLAAVLAACVPSGPFVLAGWSLGVSVALQAVATQRIRPPAALLLASGSPALCNVHWFDRDAEGDALTAAVVARRQRLGLHEHADDIAVRHTWQAVRNTDQRPLLGTLHLPAIVLHGSADNDCPLAHGRATADGLGVGLQALPGVGHAVLSETPAATAAALDVLCQIR